MKRSELRENIFKLLFMAQFNSQEEMRNSCVCILKPRSRAGRT